MLHPVLETLFLLKIARNYVTESIIKSKVEEKQELVNYIQNEASDYEVMHLVTLGEMPEEKFDAAAEEEVWNIFKECIVMNTNYLSEYVTREDIMTMVYEMGPVSELGYSSASPILEFAKANGSLTSASIAKKQLMTEDEAGNGPQGPWTKTWTTAARNLRKGKNAAVAGVKANSGMVGAAGGVLAAGAAYGIAKAIGALYKKYKAAKTEKAKAAIQSDIAKLKAKKAQATA